MGLIERRADLADHVPEQPGPQPALRRLSRAVAVLRQWASRSRARRELAALGARTLADIGMPAGERDAEVDKPFWVA